MLELDSETNSACLHVLDTQFAARVYPTGGINDVGLQATTTPIFEEYNLRKTPVLNTAGPPCPDFSRIKGGEEAKKEKRVMEQQLKQVGFHIALVVENVHMQSNSDLAWFSSVMRAEPILGDAADFGVIRRPRLDRVPWDTYDKTLKKQSKIRNLKIPGARRISRPLRSMATTSPTK